jgi:WD40 repeat protein
MAWRLLDQIDKAPRGRFTMERTMTGRKARPLFLLPCLGALLVVLSHCFEIAAARVPVWRLRSTPFYRVHFSPAGTSLVLSSSAPPYAEVWSRASWQRTRPLYQSGEVCGYSSDGAQLLTVAGDGTARLWDTRTWRARKVAVCSLYSGQHPAASLTPDGKLLAYVSPDEPQLRVRSTESGEVVNTFPYAVDLPGFSPDAAFLVFEVERIGLCIMDTASWKVRYTLTEDFCGFSQDGQRMLTITRNTLLIRAVSTGESLRTIDTQQSLFRAVLSADGQLAAATWKDGAGVWDVKTGRLLLTYETPGLVQWAVFSPDSRLLALRNGERSEIVMWRLPGRTSLWCQASLQGGPVRILD